MAKKSPIVKSSVAQELTAQADSLSSAPVTTTTDVIPAVDGDIDICAPEADMSLMPTTEPQLAITTTAVVPVEVADDIEPAEDAPADTPLTAQERQELAQCESDIATNLKAIFHLARAIRRVRDARLYRESYKSFEDYCEQKWDIKRSYGYNLIDAINVYDHLYGSFDVLPANEYQARQLVQLTADEQRQVWAEVVARSDAKPITAKTVRAVVADLIPDDDDADDEITCKAITETPGKAVRAMIITDILTDNAAVARDKLEEVLSHSAHTWAEDCHVLVVTRCADTRPLIGQLEEYTCEMGTPIIVEQPTLRQQDDWSFARGDVQILHARRGGASVNEQLSNLVVCDQNLRDDEELPFALAQLLIRSTCQRGDLVGAAGSLKTLRLAAEQQGCSVLSIREEPENRSLAA